MSKRLQLLGSAFLFLTTTPLWAHTGVHDGGSLAAGMVHPLLGWDHLLAAIGVSLWAVQRGGRAVWAAPLTFLLTIALAAGLAVFSLSLPLQEAGIALSVIAFGVLLLLGGRVATPVAAACIVLGGVWHGHAHGAEVPLHAASLEYLAGILVATAALHALGIAGGLASRRYGATAWRVSGALIAGNGTLMLAGL